MKNHRISQDVRDPQGKSTSRFNYYSDFSIHYRQAIGQSNEALNKVFIKKKPNKQKWKKILIPMKLEILLQELIT